MAAPLAPALASKKRQEELVRVKQEKLALVEVKMEHQGAIDRFVAEQREEAAIPTMVDPMPSLAMQGMQGLQGMQGIQGMQGMQGTGMQGMLPSTEQLRAALGQASGLGQALPPHHQLGGFTQFGIQQQQHLGLQQQQHLGLQQQHFSFQQPQQQLLAPLHSYPAPLLSPAPFLPQDFRAPRCFPGPPYPAI